MRLLLATIGLAGLALLLMTVQAGAQDDLTIRPSAGVFAVQAQAAPSDPDRHDTASLALVAESDGAQVACGAGTPDQVTRFDVTVSVTALPVVVRAVAYSEAGCTGEASQPSVNTATLQLGPPGPPVLVP